MDCDIDQVPKLSDRQQPLRLGSRAATQGDVLSRRQLADYGYDEDAVRRRVARGSWQRVGRAVVLHGGPITHRQLQWAASLSVPGIAAVGGRAAAARYGLRGFDYESIDVVVSRGSRTTAIEHVRWRYTRRLEGADLDPVLEPPTVRRARAFLDAAIWSRTARIACGLLAASVQQRLVSPAMLRDEVAASAGPLRYRALLVAILADIEGGADSLAEVDVTRLARRAGLPPPIRQSMRRRANGGRYYLDVDFGSFAVEVDGGVHLDAGQSWADAQRRNELMLGGDRILHFPVIALRLDEDLVVAQLRRAHAQFGPVVMQKPRKKAAIA